MKSKVIYESPRQFLLVFDRGDQIAAMLTEFAASHDIAGARFTAIGACTRVTIAYWVADKKEWQRTEIDEHVEIVSLTGSVGLGENGKPRIHAHVAVGKRDGTLMGGHFVEGEVNPTLELFMDVLGEPIHRRKNEDSGLPLIAL